MAAVVLTVRETLSRLTFNHYHESAADERPLAMAFPSHAVILYDLSVRLTLADNLDQRN